jgi:hypothetical protein
MNHTEVLKQAWRTAWHYRALWIMGMILALTAAAWGPATLYDLDEDWRDYERGITITRMGDETFVQAFRRSVQEEIQEVRREIAQADRELDELLAELGIPLRSNLLLFGTVLLSLGVVLYLIGRVARYVAETSVIRAADDYAKTGERRRFWKALGMGWSVRAWRMFLINLLVNLPFAVFGVAMFATIFAPIFWWVHGSEFVIITFALLTGGLSLVAIFLMIAAGAMLSLVRVLAWRACALEGLGVWASVRRGFATLGKHLVDVGLTWLIAFLVRWGWRLVMAPVVFLLIGGGLVAGGLPATLVGAATSLLTESAAPVFLALAVGISIFAVVLAAPVVFLEGILQVLLSSIWTLAYQDLRRAESLQPVPVAGKSNLEAAPAAS